MGFVCRADVFISTKREIIDFQRHMLWVFIMLNELRKEDVVCFVDIDQIVDHYKLSFLFTRSEHVGGHPATSVNT